MKIGFCGYSYHIDHYHNSHRSRYASYLFRLQTEGTAQVKTKAHYHNVEKGDLLIVKPHENYELFVANGQASGDFHLYCEGDWIDNRFKDAPMLSTITVDDGILNLWHQLIIEERRPKQERNHELTHYLLSAFCIALERAIFEQTKNIQRPYVVTKMMRFIEEYATKQGLMIEDVANHSNLSISRCGHLFKEHVNMTIIDYAQSIRMTTAINQMKYTTMTLENIAYNCGFGSYSYFHRVFKRKYEQSPTLYRKKIE